MQAKQQKFTIGYFVAAVLALFLVQALRARPPHVENLSYSEFKSLVAKDKVSNLVIASRSSPARLPPMG